MTSQLRVPGQPDAIPSPILLLTQAIANQSELLGEVGSKIVDALKVNYQHIYALQPVEDVNGPGFITYCLACSQDAAATVFPCRVNAESDMPRPPAVFAISAPVPPTSH